MREDEDGAEGACKPTTPMRTHTFTHVHARTHAHAHAHVRTRQTHLVRHDHITHVLELRVTQVRCVRCMCIGEDSSSTQLVAISARMRLRA